MRGLGGRAALLALLAVLLGAATTSGAAAQGQLKALPQLLLPGHPDGLERALQAGRITPAKEALLRAQALFRPRMVAARYGAVAAPGRFGATMILRDLALRQGGLPASDRAAAQGLLARPTDPYNHNTNPDGWQGETEAAASPECGPDICIHWTDGPGGDAPDLTDADVNGFPDYVDSALAVAEHVWDEEVNVLGYRHPLDDSTSADHGPDGKLDIYLSDLGSQGLYGYCTSDDPKIQQIIAGTPGLTYDVSAYCVVDNNYTETAFQNHTPIQNLKVTLAHEFFHAVQFAYDFAEDIWFMEGTATWMEDEVYTSINDNRQYLMNSQMKYPWVSLDRGSPTDCCFQYGSWIFFRYLSESLDSPAVVRQIWNRAASAGGPDDYSTQAVRDMLRAHHLKWSDVYATFGVWNELHAKRYSEGAGPGYPNPVASGSYALGKRRHSTGWLGVKLKHMSEVLVNLVPGRSAGRRAHVTVAFDGPKRAFGPAGKLIVITNGGSDKVKTFSLGRRGNDSLRVAFGRGHIKRVALLMDNASTRFHCWNNTYKTCQGTPLDDGRIYAFKATIS